MEHSGQTKEPTKDQLELHLFGLFRVTIEVEVICGKNVVFWTSFIGHTFESLRVH